MKGQQSEKRPSPRRRSQAKTKRVARLPEHPNEEQLERFYPDTQWREPNMYEADGMAVLVCHYCTAMHGLKGTKIEDVPRTVAQFREHLRKVHNRSLFDDTDIPTPFDDRIIELQAEIKRLEFKRSQQLDMRTMLLKGEQKDRSRKSPRAPALAPKRSSRKRA